MTELGPRWARILAYSHKSKGPAQRGVSVEGVGGDLVVIDDDAEALFQLIDDRDYGHGVELRDAPQQGGGCLECAGTLADLEHVAQDALDVFDGDHREGSPLGS